MDIAKNLSVVREKIPKNVKLVAVTKTHGIDVILQAYNAGHRVFGENKVQELIAKQPLLPEDIEWHHIGHLQTNKVKYLAPFVSMIHAVDSIKLLREINKEALKCQRNIPCLFQVHIAMEDTKFGFSEAELFEIIESGAFKDLPNVSICGLMGMATFTDDESQVRSEFKKLKLIFDQVKARFGTELPDFQELSMGMSDDYQLAIEEGSTIVRIGSLIFGSRHCSI